MSLFFCAPPAPIRLDPNPYDCAWDQGGGGPGRASYIAAGNNLQPKFHWKKHQDSPLIIEPTLHSGALFIPSPDDKIYIVSLKSGGAIGTINLKDAATGPCSIYDSLIVINEAGQRLVVENWATRKTLWVVDLEGTEIEPLLLENRIYWQDGQRLMHCYEVLEGKRVWDRKLDYNLETAPVADSSNLVLIGRQGTIECLSPADGSLIWHVDSTAHIRNSPAIFGNALIYSTADGQVSKLSLSDGRTIWNINTGSTLMAPLATDGQGIYLGTTDNRLIRISFASGKVDWEIQIDGPIKAGALVIGDLAVFAGLNHKVLFVDKNTGSIRFQYETMGMLSARPVACLNRIYVVGDDRNLYCFQVSE
jgi:outer membrane protein assembly factor BamB